MSEGRAQRVHLVRSALGRRQRRVLVENLRRILDAELRLRARECAVDARGGLGRVAAHEGVLVQQEHAPAILNHCVRGGEAGEAAAVAPVKVKAAKPQKAPKMKPVAVAGEAGEAAIKSKVR